MGVSYFPHVGAVEGNWRRLLLLLGGRDNGDESSGNQGRGAEPGNEADLHESANITPSQLFRSGSLTADVGRYYQAAVKSTPARGTNSPNDGFTVLKVPIHGAAPQFPRGGTAGQLACRIKAANSFMTGK